jgi:uncharacterized protein (TIGR03118 family)
MSGRVRLAVESLDERSLPSSTFVQTNLVSDQAGVTRVQDPNLIGAFGIALDTVHPVNQSFGFAIPANLLQRGEVFALGTGSVKQPSSIDLGTGLPTVVVFNASGSNTDFLVTGGVTTRPAAFVFANSAGQIVAWNPLVGEQDAFGNIQTFSLTGHVEFQGTDDPLYFGLTLGKFGGANFLYAADRSNGKIDVIDGQFHKITLGSGEFESFTDPNQPSGYKPFGIQTINGKLFVSYTRDGTVPADPVARNGFIDVFEPNGHFDGRLITGGDLNAPHTMALAPAGFGDFGGALIVGNFNDGQIHAYNPTTGAELGTVNGPNGQPITIQGLKGLAFGGGNGTVGDANTLYFSADLTLGQHGVFGGISLNPGTAPQIASVVVGDGTAQRSMVTQLRVAFDQHVILPPNAADAFGLSRQGDGATVNLNADVNDLGAGTVVTLTFFGGAVEQSLLNNPSLADGRYTLTVRAGQVGGLNGALDGNGDGTNGDDFVLAGDTATNKLFRLFGDVNGDAAVDGFDLTAFRNAFGSIAITSLSPFDVNGDGAIDGLDLTAFRNHFGVILT